MTARVVLDCNNIRDWDSFHEEFARVFGFPDLYGKNMDAWIDCLASLDAPEDAMSSIHCKPGSVVTLELSNVRLSRIASRNSITPSLSARLL